MLDTLDPTTRKLHIYGLLSLYAIHLILTGLFSSCSLAVIIPNSVYLIVNPIIRTELSDQPANR